MPANNDLAYLLHRAEQEAITAIVVGNTPGSEIHFDLSRRYSALAVRVLTDDRAESFSA